MQMKFMEVLENLPEEVQNAFSDCKETALEAWKEAYERLSRK